MRRTTTTTTGTVIVGAGQAGLALSWALTGNGHDHVLLERGRVGERWRSARWDSLALLTPSWANRLPGDREPVDPDGFLGRDAFVDVLDGYAASFGAPVREHTPVLAVERHDGGFEVTTDAGDWRAANVVVATGWCDVPAFPAATTQVPTGIAQLHSSTYTAPDRLPEGGVLIVGAGATGQQLAYELAAAGRDVVLAVGRHARVLRRYRGQDHWAWMRELGRLRERRDDARHDPRRAPEPSLPLDGRDGGRTLDLGVLRGMGVTLAGRLERFEGARAHFDDRLPARVAEAEASFRGMLERIDRHIADHALDAHVPAAEAVPPIDCGDPPPSVDLQARGIRTVLWATGYRRHHPWLRIPVHTAGGDVVHHDGVTAVPGLYVLGMQWQRHRTSHQIGGVGVDALALAGHILDGRRRTPLRVAA